MECGSVEVGFGEGDSCNCSSRPMAALRLVNLHRNVVSVYSWLEKFSEGRSAIWDYLWIAFHETLVSEKITREVERPFYVLY